MNSNKEHWILCPACGSKMRARLLPDTVSVGSFNSVLKNSGYILMFSSSEAHLGVSENHLIPKLLQVVYWVLVPLLLVLRNQLYHLIIQLIQQAE